MVAPQGTELLIILTGSAVYAVNGSSGNVVWNFSVPGAGPNRVSVVEGVVSVLFVINNQNGALHGVDLNNGTSLWQVNGLTYSSFVLEVTPLMGIVINRRNTSIANVYVEAIDLVTGERTEWAELNRSRTSDDPNRLKYDTCRTKWLCVCCSTHHQSPFRSSTALQERRWRRYLPCGHNMDIY